MADDGSPQQSVWPLPKFYFLVEVESIPGVNFQEASGLDIDEEPIEYRNQQRPVFSTIKMPGVTKSGTVTLKKGVFQKDNGFFQWYAMIKMNTIKRENIHIKLLDESGTATMVWTLHNAWPSKITGTDLKSDGDEVAIESLELVYESLTISNG